MNLTFPILSSQCSSFPSTSSLECIGRCRFDIESDENTFKTIFSDLVSEATDKGKKAIKNAIITKLKPIISSCCDPSIVDAEVLVSMSLITFSDGLIGSLVLDAGATTVLVHLPLTGTSHFDLSPVDVLRLPKTRLNVQVNFDDLAAHTSPDSFLSELVKFTTTLDIRLTDTIPEFVSIISWKETAAKHGLKIQVSAASSNITDPVDFATKLVRDVKIDVALSSTDATTIGTIYAATCRTDRTDKLYTTVVCTRSGVALGLVYSSIESIVASLECGRGVYYSRSRNGLWRKGDTSGHYQILHRIDVDCDGDALRFTVTQKGDPTPAFCHLNTLTCWGAPRGLQHLEETLNERMTNAPQGSYTKRLFDDEELLRNKLVEEAQELSEATSQQHVGEELADVLYFAMVRAVKAGVSVDDAVRELDLRSKKVTRRPGNSKEDYIASANTILNK